MSTTTLTVVIEAHTCSACGVVYGLSTQYQKRRREDHQSWWCPNGHSQYYPQENAAEKAERLRKAALTQLEMTQAALTHEQDQRQAAERSLSATKGVVTRMKKRVVAGTCPVGCRRHFADLQAHIETKHPGYAGEPDHA